MDDLTAEAGLMRDALYHNFGGKKGLLQAVIDQIDAEMAVRLRAAGDQAETAWLGSLDENIAISSEAFRHLATGLLRTED